MTTKPPNLRLAWLLALAVFGSGRLGLPEGRFSPEPTHSEPGSSAVLVPDALGQPLELVASLYSLPPHYCCLPDSHRLALPATLTHAAGAISRPTAPPGVEIGTARVLAIRGGAAESTGADMRWTPLRVGSVLFPGTAVRTDLNCMVDLFLKQNGPVVRVTPGSELGLTRLYFTQEGEETVIETVLTLRRGRILGNVKKLSARSKYEVITPNGVCGLRGTEFDISTDGTVTAISGAILFTTASGSVLVNAGMTFISRVPQGVDHPTLREIRPKKLFGE